MTCAVVLVGAVAVPGLALAQADPSDPPDNGESAPPLDVPEPVPGDEVCTVSDPRLVELSGLVALDDGGYIVVNDGQLDDSLRPIFFLDAGCNVIGEQSFFPGQPRDPEDMELDHDSGVLWIGDTGDNQAAGTAEGEPRETVALWLVDLNAEDQTPVIHRFVYPDGQPRDAEALVLDGDGVPIIITKTVGPAELYKPTELRPDNPPEEAVPLELVGEFDPPDTGTDNRFAAAGRRVITGGAVSPDGTAVVLRTYADALEFDVVDGDVATAITTGQPRVTPLPGEPQGESITYTPDGELFLTVSDAPAEDVGNFTPVILRYTPTPPPPEPTSEEQAPPPAGTGGSGFSLFNSVRDIINLIAGVGVLGLILVAIGVFGIVRARRRTPGTEDGEPDSGRDGGGDGPGHRPDGGGEQLPAGSPATGRARPPAEPESGWEPGAGGAGPAQPAGVYTSQASTGYGGPQYAESEYQGTQYGGAGAEYGAGTEYGGRGPEYGGAGTEYGGRGPEYGGAAGYGANEYAGTEYGGAEHGNGTEYHRGTQYGGTEYGGGREYQGTEYGGAGQAGTEYGGAGYAGGTEYHGYDQGYGQDHGRAGPAAGGYPGQAYQPGWSNGEHGYPPGYAEDPNGAGGSHADGAHQARQPGADYYSDDPDYPYEFRQPGRW